MSLHIDKVERESERVEDGSDELISLYHDHVLTKIDKWLHCCSAVKSIYIHLH